MPEVPTGRFIWYDLMTTEPDAAQEFYAELIGWGTAPWEGGETPYIMWMNGEKALGGIMELPQDAREAGAPPHWLAYISTRDIDATVDRAKSLGGEVLHGPQEIPEAGSFAILQDPQGAVFAVHYSDEEMPAPSGPLGTGEFSWNELATTDYEAAYGFYADLFGWEKKDAVDMGEGWMYQLYGRGDHQYGGIYNKPDMMPVPNWLFYITVEDCHQAAEQVKELGGQVINGPEEVPGGGYVCQCLDPQGAMFALHSPGATEE